MYRLLTLSVLLISVCGTAVAQVSPMVAPEADLMVARIDDSDLRDEETLDQLMQLEYDRDKMSMGAAVGSSFIPGAGWGLMYAKKDVQAIIPFTLSAIGYAMGGLYLLGAFDKEQREICRHKPSSLRVADDECKRGTRAFDANNPDQLDNQDIDPRSGAAMKQYFETQGDYEVTFAGEDFNGAGTGLVIMAGTYLVTTALGAVWAGLTVKAHNDQLRKDIESTAQNRRRPAPAIRAQPLVAYTGDRGFFGVRLDF